MDPHDDVAAAIAESAGGLEAAARLEWHPEYDHYLSIECDDCSVNPDGSTWYWGTTDAGELWDVVVEAEAPPRMLDRYGWPMPE